MNKLVLKLFHSYWYIFLKEHLVDFWKKLGKIFLSYQLAGTFYLLIKTLVAGSNKAENSRVSALYLAFRQKAVLYEDKRNIAFLTDLWTLPPFWAITAVVFEVEVGIIFVILGGYLVENGRMSWRLEGFEK